MTALDRYLPSALIKALDIIADVCVFILAIVMISVGWKYASTIGSKGTYVSMPKVSRFWMYFPIPVAGVAMIVFELEALYNDVKGIFIKEEEKA
jgi:TRAP-type C4-dicarboxylate transport system permease small subunit